MKIISRGAVPIETWPKRLACPHCESELEVEVADLHHGWYTSSYDSYGDTLTAGVYVHCPVCPGGKNGAQQVRVIDVLDSTVAEVGDQSD